MILQEAINTFSFSPHTIKELPRASRSLVRGILFAKKHLYFFDVMCYNNANFSMQIDGLKNLRSMTLA